MQRKSTKIGLLVTAGLLVMGLGIWGYQWAKQEAYWRQLGKELMAEEDKEKDTPLNVQAGDTYVNDFKYTAKVTIGPDGFSSQTLAVKPETKLIFTGADDQKHRVALAPGSLSPKYFDPKLDLTSHTIFQTKVVEAGSYSFYDTYNPSASLVVTVTP